MMSKKDTSFVHIDATMCLRSSLISHNSGYDASKDLPINLRPFVLLAYVCGFDRNKELMKLIKDEWREQTDGDAFIWAKNITRIIQSIGGSGKNEL